MEDNGQQSFPLMPLAAQKIPRKKVPRSLLKVEESSSSYKFESSFNQIRRLSKYEYNALQSQEEPLEDDYEQQTARSPSRFQKSRDYQPLVTRFGLFSGGWRTGCTYCAISSTMVFLANTILTIWASTKPSDEPGIGILFQGSCEKTKKLSLLAHLIINFLGTLMLSASNYTMQCLSAPTRAEVDRAHARKKWLDIGVPSVRNLGKISLLRIALWSFLAMSSVPLHFMYNSAIFPTTTTYSYVEWILSEVQLTSQYSSNFTSWDRLTNRECIRAYGKQFISDRKDLVIVVSGNGMREVQTMQGQMYSRQEPFSWICESFDPDKFLWYPHPPCDINNYIDQADSWQMNGTTVQYCLSEPMVEKCSLQFSMHIMIAVIICNAVKSICMFYTVFKSKESPLVTVGDAVASFLDSPDNTTVGLCIVSKKDIKRGIWKHTIDGTTRGKWNMQLWKPYRAFWLSAASIGRWVACNVLALTAIGVAASFLYIGLAALAIDEIPRDLASLRRMGLGAIDVRTLMGPLFTDGEETGYKSLIACVLTANLPQAIFSFLYLLYNSIFTCMLLGDEWDRFSTKRRTLRVTSPVGAQRTTHFLQLPYKYGLPLMIASGVMHWLISQSLFLARINTVSIYTHDENANYASQVGWSPIAVIFVLILGSIMLLVALGVGFRRYMGGIPLVGSCSAAISAACHPNPEEPSLSTAPILWGVVRRDGVVGHCSFSAREVLPPVPYQHYAGKS